ncbi:MAG TPA: DUF4382 domain-containing protein [Ignavibacteriaceae bacterium]|nr:DUF4382 domain-containing protein [Ignavibacteriaceae bacterium]
MKKSLAYSLILLVTAFLIASCSNATEPGSEGRIKINLVDAPSLLDSVIVDVIRVEVHKSGSSEESGWIVVNEVNKKYDLLKLTNGASVILGDAPLEAGSYSQIRLVLGNDNYVKDNGIKHTLIIPSGQQSGIKLDYSFVIEPNTPLEFYLDFDANKSIKIVGNGVYKLNPVIRVETASTSGSISGIVLPTEAHAKVFTVAGTDTIATYPDATGKFKLVAIPAGVYTVHLKPDVEYYPPGNIYEVEVFPLANTDIGTIELNP